MAGNKRLPVVANTLTNGLGKQTLSYSGGPGEFSISYSREKGELLKGKDDFSDYTVSPSEEWELMKLCKKVISKSH